MPYFYQCKVITSYVENLIVEQHYKEALEIIVENYLKSPDPEKTVVDSTSTKDDLKDLLGEDMGDCLFEIGDYIKLSNIINRLICDKELRDNIGKLNYNNAKNKYTNSNR